MAKLALCIKHSDAPAEVQQAQGLCAIAIPESFWNIETQLVDRAICETDRSTLQLLPYIVLKAPDDRIYCYHRGGSGAEARLHGKLSIGLGGHVDVAPGPDSTLFDTLNDEAMRELEEETCIKAGEYGGFSAFDFTFFLVDPKDDVGSVHMGLTCSYSASEEEIAAMQEEEGMVEKGSFMTLEQLRAPGVYERLENWSKAVVDQL